MNNIDRSIINIFENLFKPINNKDFGLYWLVSNKKAAPLDNAEALLKYINNKEYEKEGYFIERYANLTNDLILENNIYLDFDLNKKTYLKNEKGLTEEVLTDIKTGYPEEEEDKEGFERLQNKINTNFSYDSGYTAGYKAFIDSLDVIEEKIVLDRVKDKEKEEIKGKSEKEIQQYYIYKFEQGYLKEPFQEVITVAKYLESIGLKVVLNLSGSKGFHLRIPITRITFKGTELEEKPENVKLFLAALVELIETKLLNVNIRSSSLDYSVLYKGMQRIPTSKHNKTKLHANFIHSSINYLEAIDKLKEEVPSYVPEVVNLEENTKNLTRSNIFKKAVEKAVEDSTLKTYESEAGNVNYKFKDTNNKKLVDVIKEFYPASKNFIPFKIMHLLKRSGFSKNEIEAIFHEVEPNLREYNRNFKGNVTYTFKENAKICGLRNLIEEINKRYPNNEKAAAVKYFMANFSSYEKPVETTLEETLTINGKEYKIIYSKTSKEGYYLIKNFHEQGLNLEYHKTKHFILLRKNKEIIAKLRLKKTVEGVEAIDKGLKRFKNRLKNNGIILDFEEVIEELDILFTDSEEINSLEEKNPIEKLADNPRNIGALMDFSKRYLEPIAKISVAYNPDIKENEQYIFNNGYFEKLKEPVLHKFIEDNFNLRLPADSVKTLLNSIPSNNTFNYDYFQFSNNIFFNGITGKFEKKEAGFLTDKKVGMLVNNKFRFVRRLTEEELAKDTKENGYSDLETLVYTIMSVPGDKEESVRRYKGFLEWLGYIFRPINTNKKIINLEGLGDDGKSTLLDILIKVVPDYSVVVLPTELNKDFTEAMIGNNHLIVFDEAKTDEIVKHENYIKNASNGRSNRSSRIIHSKESIDNLKFGLIFILSNLPIAFNPSDEALMEREDIVHMFRRFKQNPDKSKGELEAKDVNPILDTDFRGFERIVNLGIIQYNKIRTKKNFELSTTITETQELILGNDIIKRFLAIKTRYDKASVTTNETLTTAFLKWAEAEDIDLTEHFNYKNERTLKNYIKKQLGSKIKEHYRNIKEEDLVELNEDRKKQYSIRILTNSEVTERDNLKYCINEEEQVINQAKYLTGLEKVVYDAVHNLTEASINTLIKETDVPEVELIKTLANLETWDYIEEI